MRGFKLFSGVLLAALLVALPVSVASAKGPTKLVLTEGGEAVATGSSAIIGLQVHGCLLWAEGKVTTNEAKTDAVAGGPIVSSECASGESIVKASVSGLTLSLKGKAALTAEVIEIEEKGCEYKFTKFKTAFEPESGSSAIEGLATGKLANKKAPACKEAPKTESGFFFAEPTGSVFGSAFETELK